MRVIWFKEFVFTILLSILLHSNSIQGQNIEMLEDCIIAETSEVLIDIYGSDKPNYFDYIIQFEAFLLKNGLLHGIDRISYLKLYDSFLEFNESSDEQAILKSFEAFEEIRVLVGLSILDILFNCPYRHFNSDEMKNDLWNERLIRLEELSSSSYMNEKAMAELVSTFSEQEFSRISIRSLILCMIIYSVEFE